jgi:hypothetical protein
MDVPVRVRQALSVRKTIKAVTDFKLTAEVEYMKEKHAFALQKVSAMEIELAGHACMQTRSSATSMLMTSWVS